MTNLWAETIRQLAKGIFTKLERTLGGPAGFDRQIVEWRADPDVTDPAAKQRIADELRRRTVI